MHPLCFPPDFYNTAFKQKRSLLPSIEAYLEMSVRSLPTFPFFFLIFWSSFTQ